jgi:hypothetical protein
LCISDTIVVAMCDLFADKLLRAGRHSTKIQLPSATPLVLPFPGKQLVPGPPLVHWGMNNSAHVPVGYPQIGSSITLLPEHTYHVSLAVQATPPGTIIELLGGLWYCDMQQK